MKNTLIKRRLSIVFAALALAMILAATSQALTITVTSKSGLVDHADDLMSVSWTQCQVDDQYSTCTYIRVFEGGSITFTRSDESCGNTYTLTNTTDNELNCAYYHVGDNGVNGAVMDQIAGASDVIGSASEHLVTDAAACVGSGHCGIRACSANEYGELFDFAVAYPEDMFANTVLYGCTQVDLEFNEEITATFHNSAASDPQALVNVWFQTGNREWVTVVLVHDAWVKVSESGQIVADGFGEPPACLGIPGPTSVPEDTGSVEGAWSVLKRLYR